MFCLANCLFLPFAVVVTASVGAVGLGSFPGSSSWGQGPPLDRVLSEPPEAIALADGFLVLFDVTPAGAVGAGLPDVRRETFRAIVTEVSVSA